MKFIKNISETLDRDYGVMQLIGLGIVKILRPFGYKISNPFSDGKRTQVCVETVYWLLWENDRFRNVLSQYMPDTLDLCDLMKIMKEIEK